MIQRIVQFFKELNLSDLLTADYSKSWGDVVSAVRDPLANLPLTLVLFAIITLLVTMVFVVLLLFISGIDDEDEEDEDGVPASGAAAAAGAGRRNAASAPQVAEAAQPWYLTGAIWAAILLLVWLSVGWGTSNDSVCTSCHASTVHTPADGLAAGGSRPHQNIRCVDCHESSTLTQRYVLGVIPRAEHFVRTVASLSRNEYGLIGSRSCSCHAAVATHTTSNDANGLKMSHKEPLQAGMACLDCHAIQSGDVGGIVGGMVRCVTCHDGKQASTECTGCHTGDVSAINASPANDRQPRALVQIPDCSGCHDLKRSCDPCHGIRMPHTEAFLVGGHARDYARSYWYGDGMVCAKCHTSQRRPCASCHQSPFPSHARSWSRDHAGGDPTESSCVGCHNSTKGMIPGRNFCVDLCHPDHQEWKR